MIRRVVFVGAALLASCALAQAQDDPPKRHHHKAAQAVKAKAGEADKAAAPGDEPPLPAAAQKWFGDAVDGILSGANETLNGRDEPKK